MGKKRNNAFGEDLVQSARLAVRLCEQCGREGLSSRAEGIYRQADAHYAACCRRAERAFVTPIDRGDLLALQTAFLRLSRELWLLAMTEAEGGAAVRTEELRALCRWLEGAAAAWSPLGTRTDRPLSYLQKALSAADQGTLAAVGRRGADGVAGRPARLPQPSALRLESVLRLGWETAVLFRRIMIQNE